MKREVPTPHARIEAAKLALAQAIDELVCARIEAMGGQPEWYDQTTSPLGRKRHCKLARTKVLPARREGNRWLVRRVHIDAYLESEPAPKAEEEESVEDVMRRLAS